MTICHLQVASDGRRFRMENGAEMDRYRTQFKQPLNATMNRSITGPVPPSSEGGTRSGGPAGGGVSSWDDRGRDACRVPLA